MNIPKSQLEAWANPGATKSAINSHTSIRNVIGGMQVPETLDVFLQGSYKNHTNIRGDGDVDVVIFMSNVFFSNLNEQDKKRLGIVSATFTLRDLDREVQQTLKNHYGTSSVKVGDKAIGVDFGSDGYVPADVVVAVGYRRYHNDDTYDEGITIQRRGDGQLVLNYPKQHFDNGNSKSTRTDGAFRQIVRIAKHARNYAVDHGYLSDGIAPSYFIENLVYHIPDRCFGSDIRATLCSLVEFTGNLSPGMLCQNGISLLFGEGETCWSVNDAVQFGSAVQRLVE